MKIFIPEYIKSFMCLLERAGHEAYLVGGCVRDALMGKAVNDYDIAASATPCEMKKIFENSYTVAETGIKHGTLTVIANDGSAEITTFRVDGGYADGRHPDNVTFTKNIKDDLSRRDFTVNALAYSEKSGIIDCFGGISDIQNKIIRAVGDPEVRFNEDALRILRAVRFSATLGFEIEKNTADAMQKLKEKLKLIARERVYAELKKTVLGVNAARVLNDFAPVISCVLDGFIKTGLLEKYNGRDQSIALALMADSFESSQAAMCALSSLKPDNATAAAVSKLTEIIYNDEDLSHDSIIDYTVLHGNESARRAIAVLKLKDQALGENAEKILDAAEKDNICLELRQLNVTGSDMIEIGFKNKEVGAALNALLYKTAHRIIPNSRKLLLEEAEKLASQIHE